jgi:hypothetical protein
MAVSGVEDMLRKLGTGGDGKVAAPDVASPVGERLPLDVAAVDDPVLVIHQPAPRYPDALARPPRAPSGSAGSSARAPDPGVQAGVLIRAAL